MKAVGLISIESPFKVLREACGISTREFAKKYSIAKTTLTYLETQQYAKLSSYQIQILGAECQSKGVDASSILREGWGVSTLAEAYEASQHAARHAAHSTFDIQPPERWTDDLSPFHFYVKATTGSAQGFCKQLKVPASSVLRYTTGVTRSMPITIEAALRETGFQALSHLVAMQANWADEHRG